MGQEAERAHILRHKHKEEKANWKCQQAQPPSDLLPKARPHLLNLTRVTKLGTKFSKSQRKQGTRPTDGLTDHNHVISTRQKFKLLLDKHFKVHVFPYRFPIH